MNDDRSTAIPEHSQPAATRRRHSPGRRQVSWDLLRSGFVLLVVAYHSTYVAWAVLRFPDCCFRVLLCHKLLTHVLIADFVRCPIAKP